MIITGLIKSTLIDYPGKVAAVVFTQGCNFRCGFCHNPDLIKRSEITKLKSQIPKGTVPFEETSEGLDPSRENLSPHTSHLIPEPEVLNFLATRVGKLDGVVITGGEPTLQADLVDFTKKIKALGYSVKLDTNGSNPKILSKLLTENLVNYVAMDIKNSPDKYQETCGYPFSQQIQDSIKLIMDSGIDYEFRTTVLPAFHDDISIEELVKQIRGAKRYTIQNFRNQTVYDKNLEGAQSFTEEDLKRFKKIAEKYIGEVGIRKN